MDNTTGSRVSKPDRPRGSDLEEARIFEEPAELRALEFDEK